MSAFRYTARNRLCRLSGSGGVLSVCDWLSLGSLWVGYANRDFQNRSK